MLHQFAEAVNCFILPPTQIKKERFHLKLREVVPQVMTHIFRLPVIIRLALLAMVINCVALLQIIFATKTLIADLFSFLVLCFAVQFFF